MSAETTTALPVPSTAGWRRFALGWLAVAAAILLLYRADARHIFTLWWNTDTYGHGLLIPPILGWLVWMRRKELAALTPAPWLPAAGLLFMLGLLWLMGQLAGAAIVRHTALVLSLIVSVPLVLGLTVARGLLFPLFYALFMIPAGEQLVPLLQEVTAAFSMAMLNLMNVPAYNDGVLISIPNGNFEVAEACSGVRFLIAMIAFGVLVAHLSFRSWTRRIIFVFASIALSILANGIRAWGTIYIAHLTTPEFARGVDHVFYGWIFFAIVMAILLAVGWQFFDRPVDDPAFEPEKLQPTPPPASASSGRRLAISLALGFFALLVMPAYGATVANRPADSQTMALQLAGPAGWAMAPYQAAPWSPHYAGASAARMASFIDPETGLVVEYYIAVFDRQADDAELIGYQQGVFAPDSDWSWVRDDKVVPHGRTMQLALGETVREVWQYHLVNGKLESNPYMIKVEGLKARLFGGPTRAATLIVSAQRPDRLVSVRPVLARFVAGIGPIDMAIANAAVASPVTE